MMRRTTFVTAAAATLTAPALAFAQTEPPKWHISSAYRPDLLLPIVPALLDPEDTAPAA